jgi:hypothetical protein
MPLVERGNIATEVEIGIDTLVDRLRQDAVTNESVIFLPRLVGAWSRFPVSAAAASAAL